MRELKTRLYTVATLVPKGARVADIGTDHGHLPIYLLKTGIASHCIACDIKEKPLNSARQNARKFGVSGIELRLGCGLEPIKPSETDCITITGMGGEAIADILEGSPWVKDDMYILILQPMTSADALRGYLCENGFGILSETAVEDTGRIYTVIKAVYSGVSFTPDSAFLLTGKLSSEDENGKKYIEKQARILKKQIDERCSAGLDTTALKETYNKISGGKNAD